MSEEILLPKSWTSNRLGDFVLYQKGKKPKSISKTKTKSHPIAYVNIKAFEHGIIDEFTDGEGCVFCEDNDFLMVWDGSRSGYVGRAIKGALGSTLVKIHFPGINLDYAYYFLQSKFLQINTRAKGTGIPHVDPDLVWNYAFPLPPLAEQHRIVAKIEELFSELDKGIETLKTAQQQLKVYRQAVLKYAFEGRLTNPDVKEGELPEGWVVKRIEELATTIGGIAFKSSDFLQDGKYQVIRIGNVRQGIIRYKESPVFLKNVEQKLLSKGLLRINDIIITQTGTKGKRDYGFTAMVKSDNLLLNQRLAAIRCEALLLPQFLLYFTWTDYFKNQFFANETGNVGQGNVGIKGITESTIPTPSLEVQEQIVQEIESRLSVCDKIEESIEQGLEQAEALRQSILKKAFEGKLVPQNPKDEPASVLLERIKAERANVQPEKKTRTKKVKA